MADRRHRPHIANQSTQVAFRLIEEMVASGETHRVTDLAQTLAVPKARVFRYLRTLVSLGYVQQDAATERYRLTLKLFHLGQAVADATKLLTEARPIMLQLRDKTSLTVTLSRVEDEGMRVLDIVRFASPVEIVTRPGALLDFHSSAQGKVALAFGPERLWLTVRRRRLKPWTAKTNTDPGVLAAEIERVRQRGWAVAPEEVLPGVNALSAPVFGQGGTLEATLTIAGSVQFIAPNPMQSQIDAVRKAAQALSHNLGYAEVRN
jgi:DNA-binding IclR family transcriptional regulator